MSTLSDVTLSDDHVFGFACHHGGAEGYGQLNGLAETAVLFRTDVLGVSAALALLAGPLLGAILIFLTDTPLALLNVVAGVVYALAMPFVALVTAFVYFDARARLELEPVEHVSELPAEIVLGTNP